MMVELLAGDTFVTTKDGSRNKFQKYNTTIKNK